MLMWIYTVKSAGLVVITSEDTILYRLANYLNEEPPHPGGVAWNNKTCYVLFWSDDYRGDSNGDGDGDDEDENDNDDRYGTVDWKGVSLFQNITQISIRIYVIYIVLYNCCVWYPWGIFIFFP